MSQYPRTALLALALLLGWAGAGPAQVIPNPIHRYTFNDTNAVLDSVGTAHGTLHGGATTSGGVLVLDNGPGLPSSNPAVKYASLPPAALPSGAGGLTSFSIEMWTNWTIGGQQWARIIDFNNNTTANYMFVTPQTNNTTDPANTQIRYAITAGTGEEITGAVAQSSGALAHLVITHDAQNDAATLYLNGNQIAQRTTAFLTPQNLNLTNLWIGRSIFGNDPGFNGTIDQISIWNVALSAAQVTAAFQAGPVPVPEPTTLGLAGMGAVAFAGGWYRKRRNRSPAA